MQKLKIFLIVLSIITFVSCSDDDPVSPPSDKPVNSVIIEPTEITFNAIGQNKQFTAKAYDETGGEVSTTLSWASSNEEVVIIGSDGMAEATGLGNASIYVTAGEKSDTAQVTVDLATVPEIWWVSAKSGNWSDASNWNTGVVPQADDTVAITLEGDYTVTLTENVSVKNITLGAATGTQILVTGTNQFTIEEGELTGGAELQIDGTTIIKGKFNWKDGDITGSGTVDVYNSAEVNAGGGGSDSKLILKATILNSGVFNIASGVRILINGGAFENKTFAKIDFQGDDTSISAIYGGTIINSGDLVKSEGAGHAYISVSTPETFVNNGYLGVERGVLNIRDGDLDGVIDIEEDAELRQSGNTLIRQTLYSKGEGIFEIGGIITLGEETGELIRLRHVVLESILSNSISGPGDLKIDGSLLWRKGSMSGVGEVFIAGVNAKLEGSGLKSISERKLVIQGSLETESLLDLRLSEGAEIYIDRTGNWTHTGGGNIRKGIGAQPEIIITDTFTKNGTGGLVVDTDFSCEGTMNLNEGTLTVKGAFDLQEAGKIIGGSTNIDNEVNYRRLQVPEATSAVLAGTIEVDSDGNAAFMSIHGAVTIEPTFHVLIDVDNTDPIPAERLVFTTGGAALSGTLEVNVKTFPPDGAQYRVVSTTDGTGKFIEINGAGVFHAIQEDAQGVLLIRDNP